MIRYTDEYIEQLLSKFMNGKSTLEEEAQLGDYFRKQTVKPEWETYRAMFAYFDNGMKGSVMGDKPKKQHDGWRRMVVAACIAVACGAGVTLFHRNEPKKETAQTNISETARTEIVATTPYDKLAETIKDETARNADTTICNTKKKQTKRTNAVIANDVADKDVKQAQEEMRVTQEEIETIYLEIVSALREMEETDMKIQAVLAETCHEHGETGDVSNDLQIKNNIRTMIIQ